MFDTYLQLWNLVQAGNPIVTPTAQLLPVTQNDVPAMLKLTSNEDTLRGTRVMAWWNGDGAARILAQSQNATLMERATGRQCLSELARNGQDDDACEILVAAASRLHRVRKNVPKDLVPLSAWFKALETDAAQHGGILLRSLEAARMLLASPQEICVLHGDLHHDNVLDFGERGFLAIDPLGLIGERGFDFANIFTNPDLAEPLYPVATDPLRFRARLDLIAKAAGLDRLRLAFWVLAWTGLSACWFLEDQDPLVAIDLTVAEMAADFIDS